jgi:hypothetical protein
MPEARAVPIGPKANLLRRVVSVKAAKLWLLEWGGKIHVGDFRLRLPR